MLEIKPFKGYFYNPDVAGDLDNLVAPPYDVITPAYREKLTSLSKFNIAHLLLPYPKEKNYYQRAKKSIDEWISRKVIVQDTVDTDNFYFLKQEFQYKDKKSKRAGFFALLNLKDVKNITRHEVTIKKYADDRTKLLEATKTNLEPIFLLYEDTNFLLEKTIESEKAFQKADFENMKNSFGRIKTMDSFYPLLDQLETSPLYIADGHHRFEASLKYYENDPVNAPENILVYLTNLCSDSLFILPTHRMVSANIPSWSKILERITPYFTVQRFIDIGSLMENLSSAGPHSFGVYKDGRFYLWTLISISSIEKFLPATELKEWKNLDVVVLHYFIFKEILNVPAEEKIFYDRDEKVILEKTKENPANFAFFLNPPDINDIKAISLYGKPLPSKTTYFYPKIPSGLVLYKYD